ncbi:MAG: hypothetical protein NTV25_08150 [Methanothrix sp.]|nr:hypothetical protein [Methanothrix sp.]
MSIGIIMLSGAVGGIINALVSDNGFIKPREESAGDVTIIRPGFAGNVLLGGAAAFISWGAASKASFDDSQKIAVATPAQAFNIAKKMYQE